ncbi:hypothetical protein R1sor_010643 [Riccia sorocarpa]|uniref:Uncharacterized protein n=1 Tax=Riccia sorocarpa TaxID=122646 RepID=A0ABD3I2B6_9MARC
MACSLDIRSLPPSEFDTDDGMSIEGIPTMRVHKKEWIYELKAAMTNKTTAFIRHIKTTRLRLSPPPPHCVQEFFVRSLLSLPWALDILHTLVEKEFVTVRRIGEIPISVLESKDSYKAEDDCLALKPL